MPSAVIRSIGYYPQRQQLFVTFVTRKTYVYEDVPHSVHESFLLSRSRGIFFNRFIRDRYHCRLAG